MKQLNNLNERDLEAIAELVWEANTWFDRKGKLVTLTELRNEIIGAAREYAENCDRHAIPVTVPDRQEMSDC